MCSEQSFYREHEKQENKENGKLVVLFIFMAMTCPFELKIQKSSSNEIMV